MKDFRDKVVVITGGATGIGFSFARQFGKRGANIVIGEPREHRLQEAVDALGEEGIEAKYRCCDVTDRGQLQALADFAWASYGHVDVAMNNAGIIIPGGPVVKTPDEDLRRIFEVNFFAAWNGSQIFGKRFIEQGTPAAIYNLGSENALFHGVPYATAYIATKHAVLALTEGLREEMPEFVEVGLICPGFVRSELNDDPAIAALGMDTDKFTDIAMAQIEAGELYIVSHAYNKVRIDERHEAMGRAFDNYAPRYEGDDEYDVRTLVAKLAG
jgi:NAD(P)-dependent dehydrogenase (short-subunit alcohol dehydrogenase family)